MNPAGKDLDYALREGRAFPLPGLSWNPTQVNSETRSIAGNTTRLPSV
ncbi:MAG: hypothetical protein LBG44_07765 [Gemmatimonadota bacterium]|jgi:hypothetical protein|nr:hypothetical protein [Gemmatimonadota bacterium]